MAIISYYIIIRNSILLNQSYYC